LCKITCNHSYEEEEHLNCSVSLDAHIEANDIDAADNSINIEAEVERLVFWALANNAPYLLEDEESDIVLALFGHDIE
jgi:hypothetical protein